RRGRAGRLAPALLLAGLGFAGLCTVAGSSGPGGTASAQGAVPPSVPALTGPGLGGDPVVPQVPGSGGASVAAAGPTAVPSTQPTRIDDTAAAAAVAPAPTTSATGSSSSLAALPPFGG
ncbi:hypothetical protein DN069_34575, partial [Streptacidiphilus pinicola]